MLLAAFSLVSLARGLTDAGLTFGWFQGYDEPLNSVRLFKAPLLALLCWPLLAASVAASPSRTLARLCAGMVGGLAVLSVAVLWERIAYPGLWDFSKLYRTTGLFWEMHVGGAAIDVYLAMAAPFAAWAIAVARTPPRWALASLLAMAAVHACLTTFSRGAYGGVVISMLVLGLGLMARRAGAGERTTALAVRALSALLALLLAAAALWLAVMTFGLPGAVGTLLLWLALVIAFKRSLRGWRAAASAALVLALTFEVVTVFGTGNFMGSRLARTDADLGQRITHWQAGVSLLQTSTDWLFGIGLGRLPAHYTRAVPRREFSGAVVPLRSSGGGAAVRLSGPASQADLGGLFALTQRVPLIPARHYRVSLRARAAAESVLWLSVCEVHLLYERHCQGESALVLPGDGTWQTFELRLRGPGLSPGPAFAPRRALFAVSVANSGGSVDLTELRLSSGEEQPNLLHNAAFDDGLARWWPAAQFYFLPWHIDNFYLELLIERGLAGLAVVLALVGLALSNAWRATARWQQAAPYIAASLCGAASVGLLSSLMDVPRIAWLFFLLVLAALSMPGEDNAGASDAVRPGSKAS